MNIRFGYRNMEFPSANIIELRDSNALLGDVPALHQRMAADGYLLLRGLIDRDKVLGARETILTYMEEHRSLVPDTPLLEGVMGGRSPQMMGIKGIAHHDDVLDVLEGEELTGFYDSYFGEPSLTYHYKWLRGVGNEEYTGAHYDFVYMGRGSTNLHTTWIPFGDIPINQGTLAMCVGSNHLESFAPIRDTYGQMDVDRDLIEGWFTKDPMEIVEKFGGQWATTDYRAAMSSSLACTPCTPRPPTSPIASASAATSAFSPPLIRWIAAGARMGQATPHRANQCNRWRRLDRCGASEIGKFLIKA